MTGRDPTGDGLEPGIAPARVETVELEGPDTGLRDAEEAIEGWQDQIRLLFECSHDPILVLNGSSRFVDCNSAAQEVFGVPSKGLIIMKTPAEISPEYQPDGSSSAAKAFRMIEAAKERGTVQFQWTHLRPDGTQFAMEVSLSAISPGKKEALLYWRDSGCLTRVDEVVRKSEARLRQVIDLVPHFIFAKDRSGRFVLANRAVAEAYGTTVENLIGKTDADFNPKKDEVESFLCDDLDVIEGGRPKEIPEETITDWRGSVRVLHTIKIPFSMEDADCDALLGVSTDITERARAEEAARKSEERYRSIFENAVEGIFQSTPEGKFLSVNPGLASMMGYESPEEMIAAIDDIGGQQYLDPERRLKFRHLLEERGRVENFEYQIRKKDGSTGWARINARAVHGGDGRILYYEGTHENITERKKVEEDLRESEQRLSDIIQFFPDPTLVIDRDHRVTGWNLAMEELTGVTAKEMLGKGDYEYAIPFYGERRPILIDYVGCPLEEIQAKYDSVQSRGTTLSDESWVPCLAGEAVCLYGTAAALKNSRGEIVGAIESIRDVTERKRTEQRLRESEERYRTAIENSNDGVALVRGDRHIYVNRKFLDMFGYDDPGEVIGTPPDYVVHPDDGEKVMGYYVRRRRGEPVPTRYEFRGLRKDGTGIHLEVSVAAVTYKGDPASLAFMRDVTERKEAEDALTRTKNELEVWVGELERHNREGNVLRSMGDMLQTCDTESEAYLVMGRFGPDLFPGTGGALIVLHESLKTAEVTAVWGEALRSEHIFSCDDCRALRRGRLHAVTASSPGLRCRHVRADFSGDYLETPIIASGKMMGLLYLECRQGVMDQRTEEFTAMVADHFALSLSNLKLRETLREQSIRDPLTGLFNRRYMEESFVQELLRANRAGTSVSALMLDIDHFKDFNDTFGHEAGDFLLKDLAVLLRELVREGDAACRYGGEEFVLILPGTTREVARERAERIREEVNGRNPSYRNCYLGEVSVSIGVAVYPDHGRSVDEVLKMADDALYSAKRKGRNRVEVARF